MGIFLDIEGAFNNTSCDSMCAALAKHGVDYTIIRWIRATLQGWLATTTLGGLSRRVVVSRGCPQGGVLSTLLWCLLVASLLTGHNTQRRLLYIIGLSDSPLGRRCGAEDETCAHIICVCEGWLHSYIHIWAPFSWSQKTLRV